ncbi:hypothetical protein L596_022750 [Steinernema carpocapsae]|uniref:ATP-grasp domain-containing protein n=1 Tax=Steinernema carpocapsae TaxID=34508 RepID=A0A4U5MMN5_STECR|nr:hypothetical protein L596_022750 [Steinernema carpocapsae]
MTEVGLSRQQHGLKGAYPEDIDRLCRKDRVAQIAQKAGIPTAKTVFLDFTKPHSYDELLGKIQKEIGIFPMFAKPNRMAGSIGIAKIENMEELEKWLGDRLGDAVPMPYVIQEFIKGNEFGIVVLLLPDGSWKPLVVHLFHGTTFQEAFLKGKPLIVAAETLEDAVNGPLPKLDTFTQKVIDAFNPVQPQIFFVQGFQLSPGTDQYVFNEINYRPCGDRVNAVLYETCGIKLYTALALAHIVPNYRPIPDSQWNPQIASLVFYAFQKGILQSHNHALLTANVKSRIEVEWLKNPGDQIQEPVKIANALVRFKLYSKSKEERDADLEWIRENWNPDVAKNLVKV